MKNALLVAITLMLLLSFKIHGQQKTVWCFGYKGSIIFDNGTLDTLKASKLDQQEGVATWSDESGKLLFYTDGITVYDSTHAEMPNGVGLLGHSSSTQSAFIVPWIGNQDKFFLFTNDAQAGKNGTCYSIVNMKLNGGLGDVDSTQKNIQLIPKSTEKVAAVMHASDSAIWVIFHPYNSTAYNAYLITPGGLDSVPVVSSGGVFIGANAVSGNCIGYLTASLDGTRLAAAHRHIDIIEIMDFNAATGQISNIYTIDSNFNFFGPYGIEFSPNGQVLYVNVSNGSLYQYDLNNATPAQNRLVIANAPDTVFDHFGAIQVGPDSILYIARGNRPFLSAISNPDVVGTNCGYIDTAFFIQRMDSLNKVIRRARFGLPKPVVGYRPLYVIPEQRICLNDTAYFQSPVQTCDSLFWDFGDLSSGSLNYSKQVSPKHFYSDTGVYKITFTYYRKGISQTILSKVRIVKSEIAILGYEAKCDGDSLVLFLDRPVDSAFWSTGHSGDSITISSSGWIWVKAVIEGCVAYDTLNYQFINIPRFDLGNDTTICEGDTLWLTIPHLGEKVVWQDSVSIYNYPVFNEGTYTATVFDSICFFVDNISVQIKTCNSRLLLPNVFSPNDDGLNDLFLPIDIYGIEEVYAEIFDRWGKRVFSTSQVLISWNGTGFDGKKVAEGVYYYTIKYLDSKGESHLINGSVTVLY